MFVIEDEAHAQPQGEFVSLESALAELKRRALVPWNQAPNRPPCKGWRECRRAYEIVEYDNSRSPWVELKRTRVLDMSASGVVWSPVG
jgi:hypothetical protein